MATLNIFIGIYTPSIPPFFLYYLPSHTPFEGPPPFFTMKAHNQNSKNYYFSPFIEKYFSHIIYHDYGFPSLYTSQDFPTSPPIWIFCFQESKQASKG